MTGRPLLNATADRARSGPVAGPSANSGAMRAARLIADRTGAIRNLTNPQKSQRHEWFRGQRGAPVGGRAASSPTPLEPSQFVCLLGAIEGVIRKACRLVRSSNRLSARLAAFAALLSLTIFLPAATASAQAQAPQAQPAPTAASAPPDIDVLLAQVDPRPEPELFGFSVLRLGETIYDDIWAEAVARPWPSGQPELNAFVTRIRDLPLRERVQQANAWINARVPYAADPTLIDPHWASLAQTLARGNGEREDIAIAKMQLLTAVGVPRDDVYLVLASDIQRLKPDALVVVRDGDGVYVLSSRQDAFVDEQQVGLYVPIIALGYEGKWIFGHKPSDSLAANQGRANAASAPPTALDVGRAAYESLLPAAR